MLEKGVNIKTISELLGHKNITTTYNIYIGVDEDSKSKAVKDVDLMMLGELKITLQFDSERKYTRNGISKGDTVSVEHRREISSFCHVFWMNLMAFSQ